MTRLRLWLCRLLCPRGWELLTRAAYYEYHDAYLREFIRAHENKGRRQGKSFPGFDPARGADDAEA